MVNVKKEEFDSMKKQITDATNKLKEQEANPIRYLILNLLKNDKDVKNAVMEIIDDALYDEKCELNDTLKELIKEKVDERIDDNTDEDKIREIAEDVISGTDFSVSVN